MEELNIKTVKSVLRYEERKDKLEARKEENLLVYKTNFRRDSRKDDNSTTSYKRDDGARGFKGEDKRFVCYACSQPGHIVRYCPKFKERIDKEERRHNMEHRQNKRSRKRISGKKAQYDSDKDCESESEEDELSGKVAKTRTDTKAIVAVIENESEKTERVNAIVNRSPVKEKDSNLGSSARDHMTPHKDRLKVGQWREVFCSRQRKSD
ncbi:uncharacterized protein [Palaemon carinicauda]|uniref:uncharacterized protein n=1 Tax=Palaemon carinicauda TaxID=392227 RepID=UPI0035B61F35